MSIACLLPRIESGALAAISAASSTAAASSSSSSTTSLTRPISSARSARQVAAGQEQLLGPRHADRVDESPQPGVAVDQPQLRRRHAELRARARRSAGRRQSVSSSAAAEAWPLIAATTGHGCAAIASIAAWKGCATSASASRSKLVLGDRRRCRSRPRRRLAGAGDQHAADLDPAVEARHRLGERVEDLVVERVSRLGSVERQPGDRLGRARRGAACRPRRASLRPRRSLGRCMATRGRRGRRPRRPTGPPRSGSP